MSELTNLKNVFTHASTNFSHCVWRCQAVSCEGIARKYWFSLQGRSADPLFVPGIPVLLDCTMVDPADRTEVVQYLASHVVAFARKLECGQVAVVVSTDVELGMARMYRALNEKAQGQVAGIGLRKLPSDSTTAITNSRTLNPEVHVLDLSGGNQRFRIPGRPWAPRWSLRVFPCP